MEQSFDLNDAQHALVFGGGRGIGFACVKALLEASHGQVYTTYRQASGYEDLVSLQQQYPTRLFLFCLDLTDEGSLKDFFVGLKAYTEDLDLILNTVGLLHNEDVKPEKHLGQMSMEQMTQVFCVNAFVTPMIAKYARDFLKKSRLSVLAVLSAKVGSIEDNRLGGWYAYRASKAALNMFVKNIAIEFAQRKIPCVVLSLHPGTTQTELSEPYIKRTRLQVHTPKQTAQNILRMIHGKSLESSGEFWSWDGQNLSW